MAVPKRKMSRANTRARRSQWKAAPVALSTCPRCGSARRPHTACPSCGAYGERTYAQAVRSEHETY
ncbi:MAG: 50S ribosomal protein L32 [Micrococcales bacterium]|nr:50S ribosomal protein L32 [Micrococcales bacterium]